MAEKRKDQAARSGEVVEVVLRNLQQSNSCVGCGLIQPGTVINNY
jgi:hypothetical protein